MNKVVVLISVISLFLLSCSKDEIEPNKFVPDHGKSFKSQWCDGKDLCIYTGDEYYMAQDAVDVNFFNANIPTSVIFEGISTYGITYERIEVMNGGQWELYPYFPVFFWGPMTFARIYPVDQGNVYTQNFSISNSGQYRFIFSYRSSFNGPAQEIESNTFFVY